MVVRFVVLKGLFVNGNAFHKGTMSFDIYTLFDTTNSRIDTS